MGRYLVFLFFLVFLLIPGKANAQENSFITIVNPVRISTYTKDPVLSLSTEYAQVSDRALPATWLLTYNVLQNGKMIKTLKEFDKKQEFGIFLEVSAKFAQDSKVVYNSTNSWHRATSLFLSGYKQEDRKKMIDKAFTMFKKIFGYYPKSVGAWWVDSYSMQYMKDKYAITGVLGVADQYDLDGYQVWGTPYSSVYFPNKKNSAIPGLGKDKLSIVAFRWAARDPLNGYLSPTDAEASLFSIQDYMRNGLSINYYKNLVDIYSTKSELNEFAQITLGLEADYAPETYKAQFSEWMDDVVEQQLRGKSVMTMAEFSTWYRQTFKESPTMVISTDDPLGSQKKIVWINTGRYRIGILMNGKKSSVIDFRVYFDNFNEPYYLSPNKKFNLSVNLPYIIDSQIDKNSTWNLESGGIIGVNKNAGRIQLEFERGKILFGDSSIELVNIPLSQTIKESNLVSVSTEGNTNVINTKDRYPIDSEGIEFSDYSVRIPFAIKHRIERFQYLIYSILIIGLLVVFAILRKKITGKHIIAILAILSVSGLVYFAIQSNTKYYISQTEYDALSALKRFPAGKVLVYDKDCLRCSFETKYKPAAAAGVKNYISKYSGKRIVLDFDFQTAATSKIAKAVLKREGVKYIYLPRYEDYIESLPYDGKDLGLKRIYENANTQIWQTQ